MAVPPAWEELSKVGSARAWSVRDIGSRLERLGEDGGDPWRGLARHARSPRRAAERLGRLR
ncbi:MAG: hypothetical protein M0026_16690 [Nocardiopsaceae bacterium]|nr:hypothetical protein [Nocardiopsaceae bacterium]